MYNTGILLMNKKTILIRGRIEVLSIHWRRRRRVGIKIIQAAEASDGDLPNFRYPSPSPYKILIVRISNIHVTFLEFLAYIFFLSKRVVFSCVKKIVAITIVVSDRSVLSTVSG